MSIISLRLTNDNETLLRSDIGELGEKCVEVVVVAYESYSIKYKKDCPLHCHALLKVYSSPTFRRHVVSKGYKGGSGNKSYNISIRKESVEDCLLYHCKGKGRGDFEVEGVDRDLIMSSNNKYWDTRDAIEKRKEKDDSRSPLYVQIAHHVFSNFKDFVYEEEGAWSDEEGYSTNSRYFLDPKRIARYAVKRYSEYGPLFDQDNIRKCCYFVMSRYDSDSVANAFTKDYDFKCKVDVSKDIYD